MNPDKIGNPDYRYTLRRDLTTGEFGASDSTACWVMLNPSTADDLKDDATITAVKRFSKREGFDRLIVVNLFAARATKPKYLPLMPDPVGPHNAAAIAEAVAESTAVVLGYGCWLADNQKMFGLGGWYCLWPEEMARREGKPVYCMGLTLDGHPRHPLYLPADTPMVPFGVTS